TRASLIFVLFCHSSSTPQGMPQLTNATGLRSTPFISLAQTNLGIPYLSAHLFSQKKGPHLPLTPLNRHMTMNLLLTVGSQSMTTTTVRSLSYRLRFKSNIILLYGTRPLR